MQCFFLVMFVASMRFCFLILICFLFLHMIFALNFNLINTPPCPLLLLRSRCVFCSLILLLNDLLLTLFSSALPEVPCPICSFFVRSSWRDWLNVSGNSFCQIVDLCYIRYSSSYILLASSFYFVFFFAQYSHNIVLLTY